MKPPEAIPILKLIALTVISGVVTYLLNLIVTDSLPQSWAVPFGIIVFYVTFALGLFWLSKDRLRFSPVSSWPAPSRTLTLEILWASLILVTFSFGVFYLVHYPLSFLAPEYVEWALQESDPFLNVDSLGSMVINVGLAFTVIFLGPLVEELVFRGILYQKWKIRFGHWPSLIVVSLIFAVLHFDMIGGFVFSMAMITLMLKSRRLAAPILCHVAYNAFVILGDVFTAFLLPEFTWTLYSLRSTVWVGVAALSISTPFILLFFTRNYRYLKGDA